MSEWKIVEAVFIPEELQVTLVSADGKFTQTGKIGADLLQKLLFYKPSLHDGQKVKP